MVGNQCKIITYCGSDESYWKSIQDRYRTTYPYAEFHFTRFYEKEAVKVQGLLPQLLQGKLPRILYIDFSVNFEEYSTLCTLVKRTDAYAGIPVVGLLDSKENIDLAQNALADLIHVKCGEQYDVVYHPFKLAFPKEVKRPEFANAKFSKEVKIIDTLRVSYFSNLSVHVEGNNSFEKGDQIELSLEMPREVNSSRVFIVNEQFGAPLYYDYNYAYDLAMTFIEPPPLSTEKEDQAATVDDPAVKARLLKEVKLEKNALLAQYKEEVVRAKKKCAVWVKDNYEPEKVKKTKILVVDEKMKSISALGASLENLPFIFRLQTILDESFSQVEKFRPDIIAFRFINPDKYSIIDQNLSPSEMQKMEENKKQATSSAMAMLVSLVKKIGTIENYSPFLTIFNCPNYSSKALQQSFNYPLVMTNHVEINFQAIIDMAKLLEAKKEKNRADKIQAKIMQLRKKDPQKYGRLTATDFEESRYYLNRKNKLAFAHLDYVIELRSMSESELIFACEKELSMGIYQMRFPVFMSVTLIPTDDGKNHEVEGNFKIYRALIHSTDEKDKKEIRKFVNEIFFSSVNEQREKEQEAFKKLNEKAMAERVDLDSDDSDGSE